jgi:hypothetical protein
MTTLELRTAFGSISNQQLFHNVASRLGNKDNLLNDIPLGAPLNTRTGNQLHVVSFEGMMVLNRKVDRPNVTYRVSVVASRPTVEVDAYSELFFGGNFTSMHIKQSSNLLLDKHFPLDQGSTMTQNVTPDKERSDLFKWHIPINRDVTYGAVDNNSCQTLLRAYITAYDAFGTLITDNIASIAQASWAINYQDR